MVERFRIEAVLNSWRGSMKLFVYNLGLFLSKMDTNPLRDASLTEKMFRHCLPITMTELFPKHELTLSGHQ